MEMARAIAKNSPDDETKVGAIMLSEEGRLIASSYNGFLRGAPDDTLPKTRPDKYEFIQHAEQNILYNCAYSGISTKNTAIICTLSPCLECLRASYQSGVRFIVFEKLYSKFPKTAFYTKLPDVHVYTGNIGKYTLLEMLSKKEHNESQERISKLYQENSKTKVMIND